MSCMTILSHTLEWLLRSESLGHSLQQHVYDQVELDEGEPKKQSQSLKVLFHISSV